MCADDLNNYVGDYGKPYEQQSFTPIVGDDCDEDTVLTVALRDFLTSATCREVRATESTEQIARYGFVEGYNSAVYRFSPSLFESLFVAAAGFAAGMVVAACLFAAVVACVA